MRKKGLFYKYPEDMRGKLSAHSALLFFLAAFFFLCSDAYATLSMDYTYTGGKSRTKGETTRTSSFIQNYSLNVTKSIEFTKTITVSADIRASKNIKHSRGRSDENTTFAPQLNFSLINPFFSISSSYQTNIVDLPFLKIMSGEAVESTTWSSSFSTSPEGYPTLNLGFVQSKTKTTDEKLLFKQDTRSDSLSAGTNYSFDNANFSYSFSTIKTRDNVSGLEDKSPSHFGNLSYSKAFFDNFFTFRFGYSASLSDSTSESFSGELTLANEKKETEQGLFALPLAGTTPGETTKLDRADGLINGNKDDQVLRPDDPSKRIDLLKANTNIGFKLVKPERIHIIYLYIKIDDSTNLTDQDETDIENADFGWELYISSDNIIWTKDLFASTPRYDSNANRFEMVVRNEPGDAPTSLYFKVVNTKAPTNLVPFAVTDIEAIGTTTDTKFITRDSDFTGQFLNGGVSFALTDKVSLGYNVNYDISRSSSKTDAEPIKLTSETDNLSQSVTLAWALSKSLSFSSNYLAQRRSTRSSIESGPSDDTGVNTFSISFSSSPIETINGSLSLNRSQNIRNHAIDSKTDSGNLNLFFKLYRKVELGMGYTINNSRNNANEKDKTQTLNANLRMKPYRTLQIQLLAARFFRSVKTADDSNIGEPITSTLRSVINFTPSRYLSFNSSIEIEPEFKRSISVSSRLPGYLQVRVNYSRSDEDAETWSVVAFWNVSKFIYLSGNYRYSRTNNEFDDRSDRYSLRLSIRL